MPTSASRESVFTMKKLFSLLTATVLLFGLAGCRKNDDNGPTQPAAEAPGIKTVYIHESVTHTLGTTVSKTAYLYDDQMRLTEVVVSSDQDTHHYQVTCDANGNPIRWQTEIGGKISATDYAYDGLGHMVSTMVYSGEQLVTSTEQVWAGDLRMSVVAKAPAQNYENRTEYTYDDQGRMIRQDLYINGQLDSYAICQTDDSGRLVRVDSFTPEGGVMGATVHTYDGKIENRTFLDENGQIVQSMILTYDDAGNLLTSNTRNAEGKVLAGEIHVWKAIEVPEESPRASV